MKNFKAQSGMSVYMIAVKDDEKEDEDEKIISYPVFATVDKAYVEKMAYEKENLYGNKTFRIVGVILQ